MTARGHSSAEIAQALGLSRRTVEMHRAYAMRSLGITRRTQVVQWAIEGGHFDDSVSGAM